MATVLEMYTAEEQLSVFLSFCGCKDSMQKAFIIKYFLITVGSICCVKRFSLDGKRFADGEEVDMEVRKWLRQQ
jgi:hypothetical protein